MYTYKSHVNNFNFITQKPFQVALTKEAFLSALMKQQGTFQLLCMLKGTHMRPYKYCSNSEFHHVNWSRVSRHEFLERWWLLVHLAYNIETTRDYLFIRLWIHHSKLVQNRVSTNPGLTLIDTYRFSWYSFQVVFRANIFLICLMFPTVSN